MYKKYSSKCVTSLLLILLCFSATLAWSAASFVQSKATAAEGIITSDTIAVAFDSAVGSGNTVCGGVTYQHTLGNVSSISDNQGNSYTVQRATNAGGSDTVALATFYRANITNAPTTITVTYSNLSMIYRALVVGEMSGVATAPLDVETGQYQAAPGTGTDAVTSGGVTTTANGDFICGFAAVASAFRANSFTAGTGYTEREETAPTSGIDLAFETQVQSSAGSIAATFTQANSDNTLAALLTFKVPGGSALRRSPVVW